MSDLMAAKEFTNNEIATALILCRDETGRSCMVCPYSKYPGGCSERLLSDAADLIFNMPEEKDENHQEG